MTLSVALVIALAAASPAVAAPGDVRDLEWEDLMPKGWDPLAGLEALQGDDAQNLSDDSARAIELFNAYQEAVRSAPVVGGLDGQQVRLPGFMVPLDFEGTETSEFLLVPYFGACIHVPPAALQPDRLRRDGRGLSDEGAVRSGVGNRRDQLAGVPQRCRRRRIHHAGDDHRAVLMPAGGGTGEVARQYDIPFPPHVDYTGGDPM